MSFKYLKYVIILIVTAIVLAVSVGALSQVGSRGNEVSSIQRALKDRGYYTGAVDGIYGTETKNAVISFQRDRGLSADGIAGRETLAALSVAGSDTSYGGYDSTDYRLLAQVISAEARGESYLGQVAVGAVVLNRVEHPSFPDTVAGVIYQKGAFSCLDDGQFYEPITDSAYNAAVDALNGLDPTSGAIYYYNPDTATNKWIRGRPVIATIGRHIFCS